MDRENLTASDFAVFVRNLPTDATEQEVREHFSKLYRLDEAEPLRRGCCRRRRQRPVPIFRGAPEGQATAEEQETDTARQFPDPWVAQVEIARPVGGLIRAYTKSKKLVERLREVRALGSRGCRGA